MFEEDDVEFLLAEEDDVETIDHEEID